MANLDNCVAWTDHQAILLKGIRSMYKSSRYTDLEIRCFDKSFRAHRLILNIFTDYFENCDALWLRIDIKPVYMQSILDFFYKGEVLIEQTHVEGFLATCKFLGINLFKDFVQNPPLPTKPEDEEEDVPHYQDRYELRDFQLLCKNCYKCFADEKNMKKHFWGCMKKREIKCRFCGREFRTQFDIENHERTHTGEKPFQCERDGCNLTFKLKSTMRAHMLRVHDLIRYPCDQCDKTFSSKQGIKLHVKAHHERLNPFSCMECSKAYCTKGLLNLHMKTRHNKTQDKKG